jgi:hypothetical protein
MVQELQLVRCKRLNTAADQAAVQARPAVVALPATVGYSQR